MDAAPIRAYHFTNDTSLRDGSPIPPIGETLRYEGKIVICQSGLHASRHPLDALRYAPGPMLHLVEISGDVEEHNDKLVGRERAIIASIDATDLLREFARWCALQVIDLWDVPDVVRQYLETGDESLRDAATAAARDAGTARAAATAARSTALAAEYAWAAAAAAARSAATAAAAAARSAATAATAATRSATAATATALAAEEAWAAAAAAAAAAARSAAARSAADDARSATTAAAAAAAATAAARDAQRVKFTEMVDAAFA